MDSQPVFPVVGIKGLMLANAGICWAGRAAPTAEAKAEAERLLQLVQQQSAQHLPTYMMHSCHRQEQASAGKSRAGGRRVQASSLIRLAAQAASVRLSFFLPLSSWVWSYCLLAVALSLSHSTVSLSLFRSPHLLWPVCDRVCRFDALAPPFFRCFLSSPNGPLHQLDRKPTPPLAPCTSLHLT